MPLSKAEILGKIGSIPPVEFDVPEWGSSVYLRNPTASQRDFWEIYLGNAGGKNTVFRAKLAQMLLCDEKGNQLFSDAEVDQVGKLDAKGLDRIFLQGNKMMAVREEEVARIEKNEQPA